MTEAIFLLEVNTLDRKLEILDERPDLEAAETMITCDDEWERVTEEIVSLEIAV